MSSQKGFFRRNGLFMLALLCFALLRMTVFDYMLVPSGSMNPTLLEGDFIFTNRTAFGFRIPFTDIKLTQGATVKRGDIVVFKSPENGETLVKRVVALPGETVEMRHDQLIVDGEPFAYPVPKKDPSSELPEKTGSQEHLVVDEVAQSQGVLVGKTHNILLLPKLPARRDFAKVQVPANHFLMLGDNRDNSRDSRYFGMVPKESFIGRVRYVFFSLNPDHGFMPRWGRTLKALT
jgi:signal peptidase I